MKPPNLFFVCIKIVITLHRMARRKTNKSKGQLLIHDIDKMLLDTIKRIAAEEKRSVGKQAEVFLKKQVEQIQPSN